MNKKVGTAPVKNAFWRELPCQCGYSPKENKAQFEIHEMEVCKSLISPEMEFPKQKVWRCKTCKAISLLTLVEDK